MSSLLSSQNFYVYVLVNNDLTAHYTGMTTDVDRRFSEHNSHAVKSTKGRGPWQLLLLELCADRLQARSREKCWKSGGGRKRIRHIQQNWNGKTVIFKGH